MRSSPCQNPFELKVEIKDDGMTQIFGGKKSRNFLPSTKNGRMGFLWLEKLILWGRIYSKNIIVLMLFAEFISTY